MRIGIKKQRNWTIDGVKIARGTRVEKEGVSAARILENGSLRLTCDAITARLSLAIAAIIEV